MKHKNAVLYMGFPLLGLALSAGKCNEDDKKVESNVNEENLCEEMAEITCHNAFKCCTGIELESVFGIKQTTSESECRRDVRLSCEHSNAEFLSSLGLGRVGLNKENIDTCFNQYVAPDDVCTPVVANFAPACSKNLYKGLQKIGQVCLEDHDCQDGAYCPANRKCTAYAKEGASCDTVPCGADLVCEYDTETGDAVCREKGGKGDSCNSAGECQSSLICLLGVEPDDEGYLGTCEEKKGLDAQCDGDYQCESGLCLPSVCEESANACYSDAQCGGACSSSGAECVSDDDCTGDGETCRLASCEGTGVCAEDFTVHRYCSDFLVDLFDVDPGEPYIGCDIPSNWLCDGSVNCADGSDESPSLCGCPAGFFMCGSGECVDRSLLCDDTVHCLDGSDESVSQCGGCEIGYWECANGNCILESYQCDDDDDCGDGSDENVALCGACGTGYWECGNGNCIYDGYQCDGDDDCGDGSDETTALCGDLGCDQDQFECENGGCISMSLVCDSQDDCGDGSDETVDLCGTTGCGDDEFTCDNGDCISLSWQCDGMDDCGDGSDEAGCS